MKTKSPRRPKHAWRGAAAIVADVAPLLERYRRDEQYGDDSLRRDLAAIKLHMLGFGRSRLVVALSEQYVLKIHYNDHTQGYMMGYSNGNLTEAWAWEQADDAEARKLAPVVAADPQGRWLVMERTTPLTSAEFKARRRGIAALPTIDENVRPNIGWLRGRVVLHDYAI